LILESERNCFACWFLNLRLQLTSFSRKADHLCAMADIDHWICEKAAASINPAQVERVLIELRDHWPETAQPLRDVVERFPLGEAALLHLLALSSICAARLTHEPDSLLWLCQPQICSAPRAYGQMLGYLQRSAGNSIADQGFSALRSWKGREMTRIAVREVANVASLEETTGELSQVAEICIGKVFEHWDSELREQYGSPNAEFAILALGKLGGAELNHSSDVDLLFLYSEEGQLTPHISYHEFFNRLGKKILETFSTSHPAGSLFRVDLRLRPEGSAGPLARSLDSMENYYAGFGETWERLALIKARGIAGSRELAYEFLRQHQPFIYPRSPTRDLLDEIASVKKRIERDIVGADNLERDVKLGRGGIRDIEFIVQTLQLIHGARHPFLQESSMLKALRALRQLDLLPREDVLTCDNTYRFLRRVEHRLQIEAEQQTHTVPRDPQALRRLALSLRFSSGEEFSSALQQRMRAVRPIFQRIVASTSSPGATAPRTNDLEIFTDQKRAAKALADLAQGAGRFHVAPRTRQIFAKLRPALLQWLSKTADPDTTLNQFVRLVEGYGLRSLFFELLVANPRLLELVVRTFDASRFASELLIRRPQLLEDITRDPTFGEPRSVAENLRRMDSLGADANDFDSIRTYRQRHLLRIILRDVLGLIQPEATFAELSDLAEACLVAVARLLAGEVTIIGLGKFGGREISYGADLDVIFVGDDIRAAQNLMTAMAQPTAEGDIWVLDARLRPEGEKGPVVCSLETFESYYATRAQPWELQALTRARSISGPLQSDFMKIAKGAWQRACEDPSLFANVNDMLQRIRRDRGSGSDVLDLKTGAGGIIEAEFLVQALQMRARIREQNWERAVDQLHHRGDLDKSDAPRLKESYAFLRRCELVLRRHDNRSISTFPSEADEQRKLAIRLACGEVEAFRRQYLDSREAIHALYQKHIRRA
jgi:glutamate-ammonia-ligase adenylyltransferase